MEDEEDYCICHKPYDVDFEGIFHDCDNYMECSECPYYYADDDWDW